MYGLKYNGVIHNDGVVGDVAGDLVYVNYGRIEDLAELEQLGISLKGGFIA